MSEIFNKELWFFDCNRRVFHLDTMTFEIAYCGDEHEFSPSTCLAMMLNQIEYMLNVYSYSIGASICDQEDWEFFFFKFVESGVPKSKKELFFKRLVEMKAGDEGWVKKYKKYDAHSTWKLNKSRKRKLKEGLVNWCMASDMSIHFVDLKDRDLKSVDAKGKQNSDCFLAAMLDSISFLEEIYLESIGVSSSSIGGWELAILRSVELSIAEVGRERFLCDVAKVRPKLIPRKRSVERSICMCGAVEEKHKSLFFFSNRGLFKMANIFLSRDKNN